MKEIRFRGQKFDGTELVYGDFITGQGFKKGNAYILPQTEIYPPGCNSLDGWKVKPETVGQLTGAVDKYNNPIYAGDIIKPFNYSGRQVKDVYTVVYSDASASFVLKAVNEQLICPLKSPLFKEIVVIGNIYETPNLLEP